MKVTPVPGRTPRSAPFRMWGAVDARSDDSLLPQLAHGLGVAASDIVVQRGPAGRASVLSAADGSALAVAEDDHDRVEAADAGLSAIDGRRALRTRNESRPDPWAGKPPPEGSPR